MCYDYNIIKEWGSKFYKSKMFTDFFLSIAEQVVAIINRRKISILSIYILQPLLIKLLVRCKTTENLKFKLAST